MRRRGAQITRGEYRLAFAAAGLELVFAGDQRQPYEEGKQSSHGQGSFWDHRYGAPVASIGD